MGLIWLLAIVAIGYMVGEMAKQQEAESLRHWLHERELERQ